MDKVLAEEEIIRKAEAVENAASVCSPDAVCVGVPPKMGRSANAAL